MEAAKAVEIIVELLRRRDDRTAMTVQIQVEFVSPPLNHPHEAFVAGMELGMALGTLKVEEPMVFLIEDPDGVPG
jgi:hypothetical protein